MSSPTVVKRCPCCKAELSRWDLSPFSNGWGVRRVAKCPRCGELVGWAAAPWRISVGAIYATLASPLLVQQSFFFVDTPLRWAPFALCALVAYGAALYTYLEAFELP
jgi:hypothetical protein